MHRCAFSVKWSEWRELNSRLRDPKSRAIPLGYTPIVCIGRGAGTWTPISDFGDHRPTIVTTPLYCGWGGWIWTNEVMRSKRIALTSWLLPNIHVNIESTKNQLSVYIFRDYLHGCFSVLFCCSMLSPILQEHQNFYMYGCTYLLNHQNRHHHANH